MLFQFYLFDNEKNGFCRSSVRPTSGFSLFDSQFTITIIPLLGNWNYTFLIKKSKNPSMHNGSREKKLASQRREHRLENQRDGRLEKQRRDAGVKQRREGRRCDRPFGLGNKSNPNNFRSGTKPKICQVRFPWTQIHSGFLVCFLFVNTDLLCLFVCLQELVQWGCPKKEKYNDKLMNEERMWMCCWISVVLC